MYKITGSVFWREGQVVTLPSGRQINIGPIVICNGMENEVVRTAPWIDDEHPRYSSLLKIDPSKFPTHSGNLLNLYDELPGPAIELMFNAPSGQGSGKHAIYSFHFEFDENWKLANFHVLPEPPDGETFEHETTPAGTFDLYTWGQRFALEVQF